MNRAPTLMEENPMGAFFTFPAADFASNPSGSYDLVYIVLWIMLWIAVGWLVLFALSSIFGDTKRGKKY